MVNAVKLAQEHLVLETLGTKLTPEFTAVLDSEPRELIVLGGWRAGKSQAGAAKVMKRVPFWKMANAATGAKFLVWLVGPDYQQTHAEFDRLAGWLNKLGWLEFSSTNLEGPRQMRIKGINGAAVIIDTKSATNEERLGSVAPDYILGCESGQMSDQARLMLKGRAAEKRANIAWTGTIEDEEAHEHWAWYPELGEAWLNGAKCSLSDEHDCALEHNAISLPSWANTSVFPGGRQDAEILKNEREFFQFTGSHFTFNRRFAGIPTGLPYQVYPVLDSRDFRVSFDDLRDLLGAEPRAIAGFGGIDFGDVHPSSITVAHLYPDSRDDDPKFVGPRGILVVRENWFNDQDPGNTAKLHQARKDLSQRYKVYRWATDPNERYLANDTGAEAVSGSRRSREYRISLVNTRLALGKLYYLKDAPGIDPLYEEQRRVHRRKQSDGQLVLVRLLDDRTASLEDVVELVDGKPRGRVPKPSSISRRPASPRRQTYRRIA
jgi:hypothetical protein